MYVVMACLIMAYIVVVYIVIAAVLSAILLNVLTMVSLHYPQSDSYESFNETAMLVFTAIFTLECVLKLVAFNPIQCS